MPFQRQASISRRIMSLSEKTLMVAATKPVVRQGLDHIAILDLITFTARRYAVQLPLEKTKFLDLIAHLLQLPVGNMMRVGAQAFRMRIQRKKFPDGFDRETKVARMLDKGQAITVMSSVAALIAL